MAAPTKLLASFGSTVKVTGKVSAADGSAPTGTVTITDNGKVIATATLTAAAKGKVDITLPKLARGIHLIRTTFTGSGDFEDSRFPIPVPVIVF